MPSVKKSINKVYGNGKLEKACFVIYKKTGKSYTPDAKVYVQFNPSEYNIRRGARLSEKKALGRDTSPNEVQAVCGEPSVLSVTLYFDSYNELLSEQGIINKPLSSAAHYLKGVYNEKKTARFPSFDMNEELSPNPDYKVNQLFDVFLGLVKYSNEEHEPPQVGFIWGEHLHFVGKVSTYNAQYTVFDRDGTPVRAKISMQIVGEESSLTLEESEYPFESPDRTKQRSLRYGDHLWMMAQEEYGDPARWKTIAEANGILNPRVIGGAVRLKVPSIR